MAGLPKEYLDVIIPKGMRKGKELLAEGWKIAGTFEAKVPEYYKARGYRTSDEYSADLMARHEMAGFSINIGLATAQETRDACLNIYRWAKKNGIKLVGGYILPSMNVGIPKEKRDRSLDSTAFMMETLEDYQMFDVPEIYLPLANYNLVCPNAIETVKYSLMAGLPSLGTTSQISWDYPGCDDHVEIAEEIVKAIGIIQAKKDIGPSLCCYIEDGLAACCVDTVGMVATYLLDQYIYTDLCGLPISCGFGALISDVKTRAALIKALHDLAHEKGSYLSFVHASTMTQWDHDVAANFGPTSVEILMTMLCLDRWNTGSELQVVPVTEAITVPTEQELKDILAAASRVQEYVESYKALINWDEIEEMAEILKREGRKMYQNILDDLASKGVDITDPINLIKFEKSIDASLYEQAYHPTIRETGQLKAYFPNDMGQATLEEVDAALEQLHQAGFDENSLKGKSVIVGSSDVHAYGVRFVNSTLTALGAEVIDIGVDNTAQGMVDMADESGIKCILVSTHSGNALGVGTHFEEILKGRKDKIQVIMGGVMTSILPGHSEPSQVEDLLNKKAGILATNNIVESVKTIANL